MGSNTATLEERVAQLEAAVSQLRQGKTAEPTQTPAPWWTQIWGTFKDDPDYDEAMRLGREWRESDRPLPEEVQKDAA